MEPINLPDEAPLWLIDGTPCHLDGMPPRPQPGETESYELHFAPDHYGVVDDHVANYRRMRDRGRYAKDISYDTTIAPENKVVYSGDRGSGDSGALVSLVPGPYYEFYDGLWGLIAGVGENTEQPDRGAALEVEIAYVAPYERYIDKQAVRSEHEYEGFR